MLRRKIAAALAVVTASSLLIAPQALAAPTQQIQWQQCFAPGTPGLPPGGERLECGSFTAPMDWNNPRDGKTITIAVSRLTPKNGTAKSTVFTNPGGPGGPGRTIPLLYLERPKLSENAEIIGIDVRGTGASSNVTCGSFNTDGQVDPRDRGKANLDLLYGAMELQAKFCQAKSGEFGRYVSTDQTVKDLDLLRQVLGKKKVSWLGYSGGSWMGAYYATYFPKTLDRIVLDSNVDFTLPWQPIFDDWGMAFERRFRVDFLPVGGEVRRGLPPGQDRRGGAPVLRTHPRQAERAARHATGRRVQRRDARPPAAEARSTTRTASPTARGRSRNWPVRCLHS